MDREAPERDRGPDRAVLVDLALPCSATCKGCCSGSTCVPFSSQSIARCGAGGSPCAKCQSTQTCSSGSCQGSSTCSGCFKGGSCLPYAKQDAQACGKNGATCVTCPKATSSCSKPVCNSGVCDFKPGADQVSCTASGYPGLCYSGSCCIGCMAGSACAPFNQQQVTTCGGGGQGCVSCAKGSECQRSRCTFGKCALDNVADGTACNAGKGSCLGGTCCGGCVMKGNCAAGTSPYACGGGGKLCQDCSLGAPPCTDPQCGGGACSLAPRKTGDPCSVGGQQGTCYGPTVCCTGCWDGKGCVSGTKDKACGSDGVGCVACKVGLVCVSGKCVSP